MVIELSWLDDTNAFVGGGVILPGTGLNSRTWLVAKRLLKIAPLSSQLFCPMTRHCPREAMLVAVATSCGWRSTSSEPVGVGVKDSGYWFVQGVNIPSDIGTVIFSGGRKPGTVLNSIS